MSTTNSRRDLVGFALQTNEDLYKPNEVINNAVQLNPLVQTKDPNESPVSALDLDLTKILNDM